MKIEINQTTLIDQVEDSLLTYFKKNDLGRGDSIPNENSLAAELGVARSVVREALSRLKMMGLIHARPRKDGSDRAFHFGRNEKSDRSPCFK